MRISYSNSNEDPRNRKLIECLVDYNDAAGPPEHWEWVAFYAEDDDGNLAGGLHGSFEWDLLAVKRLWVADRGKGTGSILLSEAEALARKRNKNGVWVDTFAFQARGFYEKRGYDLFGEIPCAAGEHSRYFLVKRFEGFQR